MSIVSETKPPYAKQKHPPVIFGEKKNLKFCIMWYHANIMVIFMSEVKSFFFQDVEWSLRKLHTGPKSYLSNALVVEDLFK